MVTYLLSQHIGLSLSFGDVYLLLTLAVKKGIGLNRVTMQCTTDSGSSVSKMTLTMIRQGYCYPDLQYREQRKNFNAKTARSFSAPSSWYPVDMNSTLSVVGAAIECTATRPGGSSSTFRLTNNIVG